MICFLDRPLVIILIQGLGLLSPLIIYWMLLMLLALRVGKASLIFRILLILLPPLKTCAYNMSHLLVVQTGTFALKNLEIFLISLRVFAEIGGGSLSILASLLVSLSFNLLFVIGFVLGIQ